MRPATVAVAALGAIAAFFAADSIRLRGELSRARQERDAMERRESELSSRVAETAARADQIAQELGHLRSEKDRISGELARGAAAGGRAAVLDLGGERTAKEGPLPTVRIGPEVEVIRLTLPAVSRRGVPVAIRAVSGARVWEGSGSSAAGKLTLVVPTRLLAAGDYVLTIGSTGDALLESYAFRVHRER
jgi:hypothetical protein